MLESGRVISFISVILMFATIYFMLRKAEKEKVPYIRRIPALDAIDEAVGRATELGRPVLCHMGQTSRGVRGEWAGAILAGMSIMSHVASLCARLGARLIVAPAYPELLPLVIETVRDSYIAEGNLEGFKEDDIMFFSNQQWPWATGVMGVMEREKPAAHIGVGPFHGESLIIAESGARVKAMSILGTPRKSQITFLIACADYTLIGEEVYAAGAYLSKDPGQIGTIAGQDWVKMAAIVLMILCTLTATLGSDILLNLLKM